MKTRLAGIRREEKPLPSPRLDTVGPASMPLLGDASKFPVRTFRTLNFCPPPHLGHHFPSPSLNHLSFSRGAQRHRKKRTRHARRVNCATHEPVNKNARHCQGASGAVSPMARTILCRRMRT